MPSIVEFECRCCQKAMRSGDNFHCRFCWDKFHNGQRDLDWLSREEWENSGRGERDRKIWKKIHEELHKG